jgi:hypothetical protein
MLLMMKNSLSYFLFPPVVLPLDKVTKIVQYYFSEKDNIGVQLIEHHLGLCNALVRDVPYGNIYLVKTQSTYATSTSTYFRHGIFFPNI